MPQYKKKKIIQPTEKEARSKATDKGQEKRRTSFALVSVIVAIVLIISGLYYYYSYVAPFQASVITIDNTVIRMGYFLKRVRLSGDDSMTELQQLVDEQIIKQKAPEFGIDFTPQDISDTLHQMASTSSSGNTSENATPMSESEFNKWYQEQLKDTGLSDAEYKEITRISLLAAGLQQYLAQMQPTVAEQVHLNVILVANSSDANKVRARIKAGESFASVASEVSLDTQSGTIGGDIGWIPRGVLDYDDIIFSLGIGEVSDSVAVDPTTPNTSQYLVFMVSEKAASRQIDDKPMQVLKSKALSNWLAQEIPSHSIRQDYDFSNPQNQAWINWQEAKLASK